MRIGLDARKLWDGGIGTYVRNLIGAIARDPGGHELIVLLDPDDVAAEPWPGPVREVGVEAGLYGVTEHFAVPRAARDAGVQLLHAPHYTLPLGWSGPAVVTIHDLIHIRFPQFFPAGAALYARVIAGLAVRRARIVIVDSTYGRDEVVSLLGVDPGRVRVIHPGVPRGVGRRRPDEVDAYRRSHRLPAEYLLYVGARKSHKNLPLLLEALARVPRRARPALVLSGNPWKRGDPLGKLAARLGLEQAIHFGGEASDTAGLSLLYSGAALYVQPSLSEGFGFPPLEAMACGVPVLSSTGGALPETCGDAAELLPPADPVAWARTISSLLGDSGRRAELVRRGLERVQGFTWQRTARATLDVYEQAVR